MKKKSENNIVSEAFLDGNATEDFDILPMTALAASCNETNYCCLECEKYILKKRNIDFDEAEMLGKAVKNEWQETLHNVGRHLEDAGMIVRRNFNSTIYDICDALENNEDIIAAVDYGELTGNRLKELYEDFFVGQNPDHVVVILSYDKVKRNITIFDPNSPNQEDVYSIERFTDAWNDSKNYLVTITTKDMSTYNPKLIDLSDVELTEDLNELREAIAENAHDVWAEERIKQGWTYGPERNDALKQNPCLVPYSQLPEEEKLFDREMAMRTLKLVKKLGWDLIKREETALYKVLKQRIQTSEQEFRCGHCGGVIYKRQVFCDHCGHKTEIDWNLHK